MIGGCFDDKGGILCLFTKVYCFVPGGAYGGNEAVVRVAVPSCSVKLVDSVHYLLF